MVTGILHELFRHCYCQCFGDLGLHRAMLEYQKILVFFAIIGFAVNPTADGTSFNTISRVFFAGKISGKEFVRRKCPGGIVRNNCRVGNILEKYVRREMSGLQ